MGELTLLADEILGNRPAFPWTWQAVHCCSPAPGGTPSKIVSGPAFCGQFGWTSGSYQLSGIVVTPAPLKSSGEPGWIT